MLNLLATKIPHVESQRIADSLGDYPGHNLDSFGARLTLQKCALTKEINERTLPVSAWADDQDFRLVEGRRRPGVQLLPVARDATRILRFWPLVLRNPGFFCGVN